MAHSSKQQFRAGSIAVLGAPNVGKSTLVNALVGQKVAIVAPRAQTTRHRILGVVSREDAQFVLMDTPGLHDAKGKGINRFMNRAARGAATESQVNLILLDVSSKDWEVDGELRQVIESSDVPVVVALNKIDMLQQKDLLLPKIAEVQERFKPQAIIPVSALKREGLDELLDTLREYLPVSEPLMDTELVTDRSVKFLAGEMIREQLMRQLREEVPYSATVEIETFEVDEAELTRIQACIWVEREGQKAIVIGKKGEQLKKIGTEARKSIERMLESKVFLKLWVRVREGWSDEEAALRRFGYVE